MKISREELSDLATKSNQTRVAKGTHNFLGGKYIKQLMASGTHPFLGGSLQRQNNSERIENGTHNFLGDGTFQRNIQRQRLAAGTHNFQLMKICEHCGKEINAAAYGRYHGNKCKKKY